MKEQLITPETEKLAKEKGFELTQRIITFSPHSIEFHGSFSEYNGISQSFLQRWLREVNDIHVEPAIHNNGKYFFLGCQIINREMIDFQLDSGYFDTYELALEIGLQEGLKLIK